MTLLNTGVLTYEYQIDEDQLRDRLVLEGLEALGLLQAGKTPPGVSSTVLRGDGRKGGYRIRITRDLTKDPSRQIGGPK